MAFAARSERNALGEFERATTLNTQAIVLAGKTPTMAQAFGIISLYLSGRPREAVELGRESVRVARGAHNTRSRAVQFATAVTRPVLPLQGRVAKTHRAHRVTRRVVNPAKRYGSMMITGWIPRRFLTVHPDLVFDGDERVLRHLIARSGL